VTDIKQRLSLAHGKDMRAAIEGHYDSNPIYIDAHMEIERLEGEVVRLCDSAMGVASIHAAEVERLLADLRTALQDNADLIQRLEHWDTT
jgi:hypothetical protein